MKKLFLTLVAVIVAATTTYAQDVYVATLNHEGTVTDYYGASALENAYEAAADGDIITLSEGVFSGFSNYITKAITIRGAGMIDDTENGNSKTNVGPLFLNVGGKTEKLRIEGINITELFYCKNLTNAEFIKCRIGTFRYSGSSPYNLSNCTFRNCCFVNLFETTATCSEIVLYNCHIGNDGANIAYYMNNASLFNCFVSCSAGYYGIRNCSLTNCIVFWKSELAVTNKLANCIGISSSNNKDIFSAIPEQIGSTMASTDIFRSWEDANSKTNLSSASYELSENAPQYLGVDGTQVGMLGGNYPYTPIVSIPRITKCEVANKATADGKLSVNIEVTAPATE